MHYRYSGETLIKFYNSSKKFSEFCLTSKKFHAAIANAMKKYNGVSIEIRSMDNKEKLTFFDILVASRYYHEYYNFQKPGESKTGSIQLLNKSCEIGLFSSLSARCEINAHHLLNTNLTDEEKDKLEKETLYDINRLCNLYWGIGYIQAGCLLRDYASELCENKNELERATTIYEEGIRRTLCASFLETNPYSIEIEKSLTRGKGYLASQNDPKYRNWDAYKMQLCQWSGSNANYERLYNLAKQEIERLVPNNQDDSKLDF